MHSYNNHNNNFTYVAYYNPYNPKKFYYTLVLLFFFSFLSQLVNNKLSEHNLLLNLYNKNLNAHK